MSNTNTEMRDPTNRLIINDRNGKYAETFAGAGERVFSHHSMHATDDEKETVLFPASDGLVFLEGGLISDTLEEIYDYIGKPLDYIVVLAKNLDIYKPVLMISKAVGDHTSIYLDTK
jgi:hypothetical protein